MTTLNIGNKPQQCKKRKMKIHSIMMLPYKMLKKTSNKHKDKPENIPPVQWQTADQFQTDGEVNP